MLSSARMPPPQTSRRFLLFLTLGSIALFAWVAWPFASPLLVAATIAAVLHPVHVRLTAAFKGREGLSAAVVTLGTFLSIVGPLAYLGSVLIGQVVAGARWLREALASEGVAGLVNDLPEPLRDVARRLNADIPAMLEQLREALPLGGGAAALGGVLSATGAFVAKTVIMLAALYFLLAEGRRLLAWIEGVTPIESGQLREILQAFNGAVVAVVVSTLATAGVQAVLAFLGYLAAGVPQPVFFGFLTFVAALIPLVGAGIVLLPVAGLHVATGHVVAGVLLALWGVLAVSTVDNVLKPVLMRRGLAVHVSLVFLALLGGLATFGPIGFLVGPLALAFFLAMLRIWGRARAQPVPPGAASG
ncbi:MAG TPA: AI-2E family transporter [Anaeromyxobacteraceae bacterium]|nr:AI-2E family transporter [Anaeromyxobacteraceae bacterium]